ncbi:uncharacterized protein LOC130641976 [Hydractinia symbiolongicarpus]|uniref:uncharacterized protein LOC130641976 n=1 Tax=Hydractinia symbiolongicarpus TaxID=13093 RepID=UPI00254BBD6C|nr:uncharacterized protein LOC130641976 [Hydractinia symbiolongicarpus]XP_057305013.1 uncharacterized protein LOC130641976 [Hydractinia symbiolongicarpus]
MEEVQNFVEVDLSDIPMKPTAVLQVCEGKKNKDYLKKIRYFMEKKTTKITVVIALLFTIAMVAGGMTFSYLKQSNKEVASISDDTLDRLEKQIVIESPSTTPEAATTQMNGGKLVSSDVVDDSTSTSSTKKTTTVYSETTGTSVPTTSSTLQSTTVDAAHVVTNSLMTGIRTKRYLTTTKDTHQRTMNDVRTRKYASVPKTTIVTEAVPMPAALSADYSSTVACKKAKAGFIELAKDIETTDKYRFSLISDFKCELSNDLSQTSKCDYVSYDTFKIPPSKDFNRMDIDALVFYSSMLKDIHTGLLSIYQDLKAKFPSWEKKIPEMQLNTFILYNDFVDRERDLKKDCDMEPEMKTVPKYILTYAEARKTNNSEVESAFILLNQYEYVIGMLKEELWQRKRCLD